jgi:hypothetical protein
VLIEEQTRVNLEKLIETLMTRGGTFGKAVIGFALSRIRRDEWKVCFGQINFQRKTEMSADERTYDYGNFVLIKKTLEMSDAIKLLRSVFESQILKFDGLPEIPLRANIVEARLLPSHSRYGYASSEWPMLYYYGNIDESTKGTFSVDVLAKLGLPLFPSGMEATNSFLELKVPKDWYTLDNRIEIRIPDYRARITSLRLVANKMTLDVETEEIAQSNLSAKFYCKGERGIYVSDDVPFENGKASFIADEEPLLVEAHILSMLDGSSIDSKRFDYRYPSKEDGVIIENSEVQLLDMINKGENENVEFKKELDAKEFLESVVSFANTRGGTIFLGVDDDCQIKGFGGEVKAKIDDLIHGNCDPSIEVQVHRQVMPGDIPITIVEVPEGTNKPYILNNRGIFVRRGGSDRQIKRIELDDLIARKNQPSPMLR